MRARVETLVALLAVLGVTVVSPQPSAGATATQIHLNPTSGPPGTFTRITGIGFRPDEIVDIYEDSYIFSTVQADGTGSFTGHRIQIRDFFGPFRIRIRAVGQSSGLADSATFRVHTNWAQFHANPAHTGVNEFENVIRPDNLGLLLERWFGVTNETALPVGGAVQVDGVVYVGGPSGALYAFAESGCGATTKCDPLWSVPTAAVYGSPAVAGHSVFVGGDDGAIHVFDARTGAPRWTGTAKGIVQSSPAIAGHLVFVGTTFGNLYAFNALGCGQPTCAPLWVGTVPGAIDGSPAVADGRVFVGSTQGLYAFDAGGCGQATCSALWSAVGWVPRSPAVWNGTVFAGTEAPGNLLAVDANTGIVLWTGPSVQDGVSGPAVARGVAYAGGADGYLSAFDATGCEEPICQPLWKGAAGGQLDGLAPAVANGVVFKPRTDWLVAFDASGCGQPICDVLETWHMPGASDPIVTDSFLIVSMARGVRALGFPPIG